MFPFFKPYYPVTIFVFVMRDALSIFFPIKVYHFQSKVGIILYYFPP